MFSRTHATHAYQRQRTIALLACLSVTTIALANGCPQVEHPEGIYHCSGECVTTENGQQQLVQVNGEKDVLQRVPKSERIYQVTIDGSQGFRETEIGTLHGYTLYAASSAVSDEQYPVLETYLFDSNEHCQARGYTKIVRNPNPAQFKVCNIRCTKAP